MTLDVEFYSRVADRFGGYFSDARSTDVFAGGRPDAAFDERRCGHVPPRPAGRPGVGADSPPRWRRGVPGDRGAECARAEGDVRPNQAPLFADYDSTANEKAFDRYVATATADQGVRLGRHWFIVRAQQPAAVEPSHS
jgi:hypothetical protein